MGNETRSKRIMSGGFFFRNKQDSSYAILFDSRMMIGLYSIIMVIIIIGKSNIIQYSVISCVKQHNNYLHH